MANIRQYDAPADLGLTPTDRGSSSAANAASRIGGLYGQVAQTEDQVAASQQDTGNRIGSSVKDAGQVAVDYEDHKEISHGAPTFATALAGLDNEWNAKLKDPNFDPNNSSIAGQFLQERVEPSLDKLRDAFTTEKGQAYAEAQIDAIRNHFVTKTTADVATMAGVATKANIDTLTNKLSNAALTDPSSLKTSLALVEHSIGSMVDSSPTLDAVTAARVKSEVLQASQRSIAMSAAIGMIAKNPDAGLAQFSSPEYSKYISGADLKALENQAKTVQSAARTDQTRQVALQKQQAQDASDQREGQYIAKLHDDDPTVSGQVTAKAIANDFTLNREARERMITIVNREVKPETDARVSAQTSVQIMRQLLDPNADSQKVRQSILEARTKDPGSPGSITKADMADLQKQVDDLKTPEGVALASDRNEFFKQFGPTIDPEMKLGNPTPLGAQGIYRAEKDARRQEQDLRARGIDPHSLYDPQSQYFLGKPDRIGAYRPSLADLSAFAAQQKERDKAAGITSPGVAVKPGQSVNLTGNGSVVTGMKTEDLAIVKNADDYAKLPSGASYTDPAGKIRTKR